jgi:hypothetical protein
MDLYVLYSDRLRVLKEGLSITEQQLFTWLRFEASVKAALKILPHRAEQSRHSLTGYPSLPTALGNEMRKTLVRVETCRALIESVDALYAVLSDKQRKLADRLLSPVLNDVLTACSEIHSPNLAA